VTGTAMIAMLMVKPGLPHPISVYPKSRLRLRDARSGNSE